MTPKQKLNDLLDKLYYLNSFEKKKTAIIVLIDEIKTVIENSCLDGCNTLKYWDKVKEELQKL